MLDIGTGTGLIALMLAQRSENAAQIHAVEIHSESAACARQNFLHSPWKNRLTLENRAIQDFQKDHGLYDLIVSNPPFFSELTVSKDQTRSLGRHNATLPFPDLLDAVLRCLSPKGRFSLILPEKEGRLFCELATIKGLYCNKETQVKSTEVKPVERLLLQFQRDPGQFERNALIIYDENRNYSAEYAALTSEFYL
jgi:tRNA1Val (adenine37-N6)-methyltransferase